MRTQFTCKLQTMKSFAEKNDCRNNSANKNLSFETRKILSESEILTSEPSIVASFLHDNPNALPKLKWCQSTCAGVHPLFQIKSNDLKTKVMTYHFIPHGC